MESTSPARTSSRGKHAAIPPQRSEHHHVGSLTQARVDALFQALQARRDYEEGVARLASEQTAPLQRGGE